MGSHTVSAVEKSLFCAYSLLAADIAGAPAAVTLAASQMVGRKTTGGVVALANTDVMTILGLTATAAELNLLDLAGLTAGEVLVATAATTAAWQSTGVKLTAPDISGIVTAAAALELPAHNLGGVLATQSHNIIGGLATSSFSMFGGMASDGGRMSLYGSAHASYPGRLMLWTPNAALTVALRFQLLGNSDIVRGLWTNVTQEGIVLGGFLNVAGQYLSYTERAAPGAGAANTARVYAIVGGDTFTDLAAVFQDGTVDIFAQETTPLDAPTFTYPSRTEAKLLLRKEHPGSMRIVAVFPDGREFVLKEVEYHDPKKIAANKGTENPLPSDWLIEDAQQRADRLEAERLEIERQILEVEMLEKSRQVRRK